MEKVRGEEGGRCEERHLRAAATPALPRLSTSARAGRGGHWLARARKLMRSVRVQPVGRARPNLGRGRGNGTRPAGSRSAGGVCLGRQRDEVPTAVRPGAARHGPGTSTHTQDRYQISEIRYISVRIPKVTYSYVR